MNAKKEAVKQDLQTKVAGTSITDQRPEWLSADSGRGSEDVTIDDMILPRVEVLQALSPQLKKTDPQYIPGSEQGIIFNTVSGELYGPSITIIPVVFRREFIVWQDRKLGGGFRGAFNTAEEAEQERQSLENPDQHEVTETHVNFVLLVHPDGKMEEAVLSWSKSKRKVSRKLNSLVQMINSDRFSRAYKLTAIPVDGPKGEYWSFDVSPIGYISKPMYDKATSSYEAIRRGERIVAHETDPADSAVV